MLAVYWWLKHELSEKTMSADRLREVDGECVSLVGWWQVLGRRWVICANARLVGSRKSRCAGGEQQRGGCSGLPVVKESEQEREQNREEERESAH